MDWKLLLRFQSGSIAITAITAITTTITAFTTVSTCALTFAASTCGQLKAILELFELDRG